MRMWERFYLTDNDLLVPEHDTRGRKLFCKPGDDIPDDVAEKYGLLPQKEIMPEEKSLDTGVVENKMVTPPENKGLKSKRQRKEK